MKQCFDWNTNVLEINDMSYKVKLQLKGNKTVIDGKSGAGKTLICNKIRSLKSNKNKASKYDTSNIIIIDENNLDEITNGKNSNKVFIIDRADLVLTDKEIDTINQDTGNNKYIVIARKNLGIEISPNYYGELKNNNNTIELTYQFSIPGWN